MHDLIGDINYCASAVNLHAMWVKLV